jgi:hypothetical protein
MPLQLGLAGVLAVPHLGKLDELHAHQAPPATDLRLVDQHLRLLGIEDPVADAARHREMDSHRARVRAADAGGGLHPAFFFDSYPVR